MNCTDDNIFMVVGISFFVVVFGISVKLILLQLIAGNEGDSGTVGGKLIDGNEEDRETVNVKEIREEKEYSSDVNGVGESSSIRTDLIKSDDGKMYKDREVHHKKPEPMLSFETMEDIAELDEGSSCASCALM